MQNLRRETDSLQNRHLQSVFDVSADDHFLVDVAFSNVSKTLNTSIGSLEFNVALIGNRMDGRFLTVHVDDFAKRYICTVSASTDEINALLKDHRRCPGSLKRAFINTRIRVIDILKSIKNANFVLNPFRTDSIPPDVEFINDIVAQILFKRLANGLDINDLRYSYLLHCATGGAVWDWFCHSMERQGFRVSPDQPTFYYRNLECLGSKKNPMLHNYNEIHDFVLLYRAISNACTEVKNRLQEATCNDNI